MITTGNSKHQKISNITLLMKKICENREVSRVEIAEMLGLTRSTVTTLTNELIQKGYIIENESINESTKKGGRKRVNLEINQKLGLILGIEILSSCYRYVLVNLLGDIIFHSEYTHKTNEANFKRTFFSIYEEAKKKAALRSIPIVGVGVTLSGIIKSESLIVQRSEELGLVDYDFKKEITQELDIPIIIENDSRACGRGELWLTHQAEEQNFIYVYGRHKKSLGIEYPVIGVSMVFNGLIYKGGNNSAGEFPGKYRKDLLKLLIKQGLDKIFNNKNQLGHYMDFILDDLILLTSFMDPKKVYLGSQFKTTKDELKNYIDNLTNKKISLPSDQIELAKLAKYEQYEAAMGIAFSFLQQLYTIPQIGIKQERPINITDL